MQLLKIKPNTSLEELANQVGDRNVEAILAANNIKRSPNVGKAFADTCARIQSTNPAVDTKRKIALLNNITHESDIFEQTALQSESAWKITSAIGTLPSMLIIPDSIELPDSVDIMGNHQPVGNRIYNQVITCLHETGQVDPAIFNEYSGIKHSQIATMNEATNKDPFQWFKIPWGKVSLYSSVAKTSVDFPVYPEDLTDGVRANYTQMPDMLYQYEPWQIYQNSGPRSNSYVFKFHRDMWTGDHRDGKANELIRFCEANCYPEFKGSAINVSTVTLYIGGTPHIEGVLTAVTPRWSGPIGQDGWYLHCELELEITEVSSIPLDFETVRRKGIIG